MSGEEGSRGYAGRLPLPQSVLSFGVRSRENHGLFLNCVMLCIESKYSRKQRQNTLTFH